MPVITSTRRATYNEVVREMDRRGTVIETLEAEIHRLRGRDAPGRAAARREALEEAARIVEESLTRRSAAAAIRAKIGELG